MIFSTLELILLALSLLLAQSMSSPLHACINSGSSEPGKLSQLRTASANANANARGSRAIIKGEVFDNHRSDQTCGSICDSSSSIGGVRVQIVAKDKPRRDPMSGKIVQSKQKRFMAKLKELKRIVADIKETMKSYGAAGVIAYFLENFMFWTIVILPITLYILHSDQSGKFYPINPDSLEEASKVLLGVYIATKFPLVVLARYMMKIYLAPIVARKMNYEGK